MDMSSMATVDTFGGHLHGYLVKRLQYTSQKSQRSITSLPLESESFRVRPNRGPTII